MLQLTSLAALLLAPLTVACSATGQSLTSPEAYLGHPLAADSVLPGWTAVRGYFEKLDKESPRVVLEKVGTTTEGRDFVLAVISSEENLAHLSELKEHARVLADPRGVSEKQRSDAVEKGKVFLFISCAMHATECAAPQFAMQLAHTLASSDDEPWKSARVNCVVLLAPSLNPDGLDHVADWCTKIAGTPYEASELTRLYQYYAGHDNNRDWFMLTQKETRIVTELLYKTWHPQVYWDVHQQGSRAERMFVPPFRDPLDPNLDPSIVCGMNLLGTRAQMDMTVDHKTGVASGVSFDMWWNGGNRNVPVRHNIVGLLTEAASCRLASPIFVAPDELRAPSGMKDYAPSNRFPDPWPGGWWRLSDIVSYEMSFARSLLGSLSRERTFWLKNAIDASDRAVKGDVPGIPFAWLIPSSNEDRGAVRRLADVLLATGVEMRAATGEITTGGRTWPAGTLVIPGTQPFARHVKDLFEVQRYPPGDPPYDIAGWTLSELLGVDVVEVREHFEGALVPVATVETAMSEIARGVKRDVNALSSRDSDTWKRVFEGLAQGQAFRFATKGAESGRFAVVDAAQDKSASESWTLARLPRIALYSPWSGSIDEGWTRWVFDTFGVKHATVRNEAVRAGRLSDAFDVIVLPGTSANELDKGRAEGSVFDEFAGGLDPEGAIAVEEFVRGGGTLVAIGGSCGWAVELFKLPLVDVTSAPEAKEFSCPGSVLRTIPQSSAFTAGLSESVAVFGSGPKAWRLMTEKEREGVKTGAAGIEVLLDYAPTRTLISGSLAKPEIIAGQAAWLRARHGEGYVHLFGFRPQYRGWSQASFHLLFRAILFEKRER